MHVNLPSFREGFRFRLENIVRGQVSSHSEISSNSGNSDDRNDQGNTNASQEVQHGNQETGVQLLDRMSDMDQNTATQSINQQVAPDQGSHWQGQVTEDERADLQQSAHNDSNGWRHDTSDGLRQNLQENVVAAWPSETVVVEDGVQRRLQQAHEVWHEDGSREAVDNWSEGPSDPPRMRRSVPHRRVTRFHPPDDDNVYSMELRELLSRLLSLSLLCFHNLLIVLFLVNLYRYCIIGGVFLIFSVVVSVRAWIS